MKYFVLSNNTITAVISSDLNLEQGSARFIPASKETLASYNAWMNKHPDKQPTLTDIFSTSTSKPSPAKPAIAKGITNATTNTSSVSKEEADKKAVVKQFQQFINKR
ncbi:hypothetical protein ACSVIJ_07215 [Pseudomonas sp. NCHU5208]|uniref:hypothetical protein n=1 Tax=unclassified Pseudomonas TaxID=196821 RepID=UPI003F9BF23E